MATPSAGADSSSTNSAASFINATKAASPTSASVTHDQTMHQPRPAIYRHEQEDLQGDRNQRRRNHHHAHRHQHVGDDQIDHEEGYVEQEADLERAGQLRADER